MNFLDRLYKRFFYPQWLRSQRLNVIVVDEEPGHIDLEARLEAAIIECVRYYVEEELGTVRPGAVINSDGTYRGFRLDCTDEDAQRAAIDAHLFFKENSKRICTYRGFDGDDELRVAYDEHLLNVVKHRRQLWT